MARTLLAIYPCHARRYDQMPTADGHARPHCRRFFIHLDTISPQRGIILGGGSHEPEVAVTVTPQDEN
jgi:hypothetical protein